MKNRRDSESNETNLFLYFVVIVVHIASSFAGIAFCWSTPVSPKLLKSIDNPLGFPLTIDQVSWLASMASLGAVVGPFAGGYLGDKIGRKHGLTTTALLAILSSAILAFSHNLYLYYVARFIGGICIGTCLTIVPMYVGEIAEVHNRGFLVGLCGVFLVLGQLFCFAIGPYVSIQLFSVLCMISPVLFLIISVPLIPESPCYLLMKGKHEKARRALRKLRRNGDVEYELVGLTATVKESLANSGGFFDVFRVNHVRRGLTLCMGLMIIQQFTAITAILLYMEVIFGYAGTSLPQELATIIIGLVQIATTILSSLVVDRLGRRPLILGSTTFSCAALLVLSAYLYLMTIIDMHSVSWLPIVALAVFVISFNVGIGPLPLTILSEIFEPRVKSAAASITIATCFLFSFGMAKIFPMLGEYAGNWFPFLLFGLLCIIGIVFIWFKLPETKGKTLTEVIESFQ